MLLENCKPDRTYELFCVEVHRDTILNWELKHFCQITTEIVFNDVCKFNQKNPKICRVSLK